MTRLTRRGALGLGMAGLGAAACTTTGTAPAYTGKAAFKQTTAVGLLSDLLVDLFVMLIGNFADDLFEQVFERYNSLDAAVLIDDEAEMKFFLLHLPEHVFEPGGIDHVHRLLNYSFEFECLRPQNICQHVLAVRALLPRVQQVADLLLKEHSENVDPIVRRWIAGAEFYAHV